MVDVILLHTESFHLQGASSETNTLDSQGSYNTCFPQGVLGLLVVCSQVSNGMQGSRGDGVVRALPH
jgi:hypothetical protein